MQRTMVTIDNLLKEASGAGTLGLELVSSLVSFMYKTPNVSNFSPGFADVASDVRAHRTYTVFERDRVTTGARLFGLAIPG